MLLVVVPVFKRYEEGKVCNIDIKTKRRVLGNELDTFEKMANNKGIFIINETPRGVHDVL